VTTISWGLVPDALRPAAIGCDFLPAWCFASLASSNRRGRSPIWRSTRANNRFEVRPDVDTGTEESNREAEIHARSDAARP
jgi:hypothetical protein